MRLAALGVSVLLGLACGAARPAAPAPDAAPPRAAAVETPMLRSIAGWLRSRGSPGFLGADVAGAMGIRLARGEEALAALQRGFRNAEVLRIAQVPADEERDFVLFMVQRPDDQVYFYLSTVGEGLKKAFVSLPRRGVVAPLGGTEARSGFRREVLYWEDKVANP